MPASSIFIVLSTIALGTAQTQIDETNDVSTIVVKKRREAPPTASKAVTPPVKRLTPPPAKPVKLQKSQVAAPLPRVRAHPAPKQRVDLVPTQKVETNVKKTQVLPWVTLGLSVAAGAAGTFFAVRTVKLLEEDQSFEIDRRDNEVVVPDEVQAQQKSIFLNGLAATVLVSAGVSGSIASVIALAD